MFVDRGGADTPVVLSGRCGVPCYGKETGQCFRADFLRTLSEEVVDPEFLEAVLDKIESRVSECELPEILQETIAKLRK